MFGIDGCERRVSWIAHLVWACAGSEVERGEVLVRWEARGFHVVGSRSHFALGHFSRLRPDYQNPAGRTKGEQTAMDIGPAETAAKAPWPKTLPEQIADVRNALSDLGTATPEQVARHFLRARATSVQPLLESLTALGQARIVEGGRFAA